ncbi:hypothetical protein [Microbacterium sp. RURRCA19A]|uniref:hypothetical protein n=1 Tax=Microbacterium sp. RURRCA19A TaxID=1907391 RepID=UPI00111571F5|nr:hypothetical protein [Microbacterium sp. RURRCA19A]
MKTSDPATAPLSSSSRMSKKTPQRRKSSSGLPPRAAVALLYALTLIVDLTIVGAGAALLWQFAGSTVVDGPFWLRVSVFLLLTVLFGVRSVAQRALLRRLTARYLARFRATAVQLATHAALLLAGVIVWSSTSSYFLGWVVCFAASVMAVGYFWMLVSCLAVEQTLSIVVQRLVGMLGGVVGLIATAPVHAWADGIIESIVVMVTGAILLAAITLFWGAALAEDTAEEGSTAEGATSDH